MDLIKRAKWAYMAVSAALIVLGIVLIVYPELSAATLCVLLGVTLAIFGCVKLVGYFSRDIFRLAFQFDLALGVFTLAAGILLIVHPANVVVVMPVVIGVFILIDGAFKLQTALDAKHFGLRRWWTVLILAILSGVCGLFLVIDPFAGRTALTILLGATLIVDGMQNFCTAAYTVKAVRGKADGSFMGDEER